jgi:hypothetical protein
MKNPKVSLIILVFALVLSMLCSCTTQRKFNRIASEHKDWLSDKCSETFPLKPSSTTTTTEVKSADNKDWTTTIDSLNKVILEAKTTVKTDTIYSERECNEKLQQQAKTIRSLTASLVKLKAGYEPCKPDTVIITTTITVPDSAKVYSLEAKLKKEQEKRIKTEGKLDEVSSQRNWAIGILIVLGLLFAVLKFIRVI